MIISLLLSIFGLLSVTLLVAVIALYFYFKKQYKYWDEKKVPHAKPVFPFGNFVGLNKTSLADVFLKIYNEGKHERYYGFWQLHRPTLMVNDPELLKRIIVGDFMSFHDRGNYANEKDDPLSGKSKLDF